MRHLLQNWQDVAPRIQRANAILLLLDFDGTLAPIVDTPSCARLPLATRTILRRLVHSPRVRICIISGRGQDDLVSRVHVPGVTCLGSHGFGGATLDPAVRRSLQLAKTELASVLNGTPGLSIEDKGATFTLHYRGADAAEIVGAGRSLRGIVEKPEMNLRVLQGDNAWEVLPSQLPDKGDAVRKQRKMLPQSLPIYAGNDLTDEPAFLALPDGITIQVGPGRANLARFQLQDTEEVRLFLTRLNKEVS